MATAIINWSSATGLNNLANLYQAQGHYAEAEPLYQRALAIWEKTLGPDHPDVATSLENYAALLRETGRGEEAKEMEVRAKAIRAKHAQDNPVVVRCCHFRFWLRSDIRATLPVRLLIPQQML